MSIQRIRFVLLHHISMLDLKVESFHIWIYSNYGNMDRLTISYCIVSISLGGFAWHLEFKPPEGVEFTALPPPSLSLAEEDMHRAHVLVEPYTSLPNEENTINSGADDYLELIDPYFCRAVCSWWVGGLKPGRSYIFRIRSFNYRGVGDYGTMINKPVRFL